MNITNDTYLVWSIEHRAWWRWGRMGYTERIRDAGLYPREEALQIVEDATLDWSKGLPNEVPVKVLDLPHGARAQLGSS